MSWGADTVGARERSASFIALGLIPMAMASSSKTLGATSGQEKLSMSGNQHPWLMRKDLRRL